MNSSTTPQLLTLGYELDAWRDYGEKIPIVTDISPQTNTHMVISGMSGSGKSYYENWIFSKLIEAEAGEEANQRGQYFLADYKNEDALAYLRDCPRYFPYKTALQALEMVHSSLNARMSDVKAAAAPITLIYDEYMANILSLLNEDKKKAAAVMNMTSEILLTGRSKKVRFVCSLQRPDAAAFPAGSRLNYGIVVVLGAAIRSIYDMLLPDFVDSVKGRVFGRGEGVILLQGTELHFCKVPTVKDEAAMRQMCMKALS